MSLSGSPVTQTLCSAGRCRATSSTAGCGDVWLHGSTMSVPFPNRSSWKLFTPGLNIRETLSSRRIAEGWLVARSASTCQHAACRRLRNPSLPGGLVEAENPLPRCPQTVRLGLVSTSWLHRVARWGGGGELDRSAAPEEMRTRPDSPLSLPLTLVTPPQQPSE